LVYFRSQIKLEPFPDCAVPENIHTPPTEGIGISWGAGGSLRLRNLKECIKFNWNFQRGGVSWKKFLPWGRYVYFLELHIGHPHPFKVPL